MNQHTVAIADAGKQAAECNSLTATVEPVPLVVDLDGTLVRTDLLLESILRLIKEAPRYIFALPFWLLRGKAAFKQEIACRVSPDPRLIPYRNRVVEYVTTQRAGGRAIVLATASDERLAQLVADHLRLFDLVLASDGKTNLSGERKRERLVAEFGERGFDYAANARCDLIVWRSARKAIVVNPTRHLARVVGRESRAEILEDDHRSPIEFLRALRPPDWLKNLLLFVPLVAVHEFHDPLPWGKVLLAFLAFCCGASSGYLLNDLLDLPADRRHPTKSLRPFAAGRLPLAYALLMIPALLVLGCLLGALVSQLFLLTLLLYYGLTVLYSLWVKTIVLLDVLVLAGLYTIRIVAGAAAAWVWPSEWLLLFSAFLFGSLALLKRYGELVVMRNLEGGQATARAYKLADAELLASKGTGLGYVATLVLALYITSAKARTLYAQPELMWALCPLLVYWIGRLWLVAHRGEMHDDPIVFALRDRTSRIVILLMLATAAFAMRGT